MATHSSWIMIIWSIFDACCTSEHSFFSGFEAEKGWIKPPQDKNHMDKTPCPELNSGQNPNGFEKHAYYVYKCV